jgi:hypothetical protein
MTPNAERDPPAVRFPACLGLGSAVLLLGRCDVVRGREWFGAEASFVSFSGQPFDMVAANWR